MMNSTQYKGRVAVAIVALATCIVAAAARADDATSLQTERARFERNAAITGKARVTARFSQEFTGFAGSTANADSLVAGLRSGASITIGAAQVTGGASASVVTFAPPVRHMGYGDVYIGLALARERLASLGVTRPTPDEIKAALVGGKITIRNEATARTVTLAGVLTQRHAGMDWGNVAKSQGVTLGAVMGAMKSANHEMAVLHAHQLGTGSATVISAGGMANGGRTGGIITAAGGPAMVRGDGYGHGIVSGMDAMRADASSGSQGAAGRGQGHFK